MSALTESRELEYKGDIQRLDIETAGDATYYKGGMLVISGGYLDKPADVADQVPVGVCSGVQGKAKVVASGDHDKLTVDRGLIWIPHSGADQADVGTLKYLGDDGDVVDAPGTNRNWAVPCLGWNQGSLLLDFANPVKTA
ncbi:MAG: hypothetical protein JXB88_03305 [Spirochaetales bacterium]|nr:hypothetical protein [Spirochaetales bacterium]